MCKWILDEEYEPDLVLPLWQTPDLAFSHG